MTAEAAVGWHEHGEAPALHLEAGAVDGQVSSYRDLHDALRRRVAALGRWQGGLPPSGDARRALVAVEAARPLHVIIDALACLEAGIDVLLVNAAWWPRERDALFERLRPQWHIGRRDVDAAPRPTGLAPPADHTDGFGTGRYGARTTEEPVLWLASAGSHGDPTPYAFSRSQVRRWSAAQAPRPAAAVVVTGEIAHAPTWRAVLGALGSGAEVLLSDRTHLGAVLAHQRIGELYTTPMLLRRALRQLQRRQRDVVGVERTVLHQGQLRAHERQRWPDRFGGSVHGWVSATEAGGWLLHDEIAAPGVELHIEHGTGALHCRGPASADRSAGHTRPAAGWDSGDAAEVLADGRVRWKGRRRDRFVADGIEVDPLLVEEVLAAHPLVAEVAVAPRPHAERTNLVVAVLVPTDPEWPPFLEDLEEVTAALPAPARPQALAIVEDLPTNAAGAVHRRLVNYEEAGR